MDSQRQDGRTRPWESSAHNIMAFFSLVSSSLIIMADTAAGFLYIGTVCIFMWDNNQAVI